MKESSTLTKTVVLAVGLVALGSLCVAFLNRPAAVSSPVALSSQVSAVVAAPLTRAPSTTPSIPVTPLVPVPQPNLTLSIIPAEAVQGDPVMITVSGTSSMDSVRSASLVAPGSNLPGRSSTTALHFTDYDGTLVAFYGTGIDQTLGSSTVVVTMRDGTTLKGAFTIIHRTRPTESLPVPDQLGGNSTSSQQQLISNLSVENAALATVRSNQSISFWDAPFAWPIHPADVSGGIVITDTFGYNRDSGAATIIHKGTDFKASVGTPVYAVNAGYVRMARSLTIYGGTVIVDHGMGLQSWYMHLSKTSVTVDQPVKKGQLIGYSGETGYAEGPHLHLTIRVGGVSVDPLVFLSFFGLKP